PMRQTSDVFEARKLAQRRPQPSRPRLFNLLAERSSRPTTVRVPTKMSRMIKSVNRSLTKKTATPAIATPMGTNAYQRLRAWRHGVGAAVGGVQRPASISARPLARVRLSERKSSKKYTQLAPKRRLRKSPGAESKAANPIRM